MALILALGLAACSPSGNQASPAAPSVGLGARIAAGEVRALLPSSDGASLAWLDGCRVAKGQYLPPGTASCDLRVAPASGGDARRIASAVTTLPHGLAWSPAGASLAALADYDYAAGKGTLVRWAAGEAKELAREVSFVGFGHGGELGFVAGGRLEILLPGEGEPRRLEGGEGIATFDLSPAEPGSCEREPRRLRLLARQERAAGGRLLAADCRLGAMRAVAGKVGEYGFSPDGAQVAFTAEGEGGRLQLLASAGGAPRAVGRAVQRFAFGPAGGLAFVADVAPGKQGNLYRLGPGDRVERLAVEVGEFRWARAAPRLAWIERYDPRTRSGVVGVGGPGAPARSFGKNVTDFDLSPDGRRVAYLQHTTRGGYSVDLVLAEAEGKGAPATVAHGVFGFSFSPDGAWLYYRTRCTRNGEGCDLERVPAAGLAKDGKAEPIAEGMKSFEFDPRDPGRLLVGWQRKDRPTLDVGVWQGGRLVAVDQNVLPGSARFLGPDSRRLGYAVVDPKRAGAFVATLPGSPREKGPESSR